MWADGLSPPRASRPSSRLDLSQRPQAPPFNPGAHVSTFPRAAQRALCGGARHRTRPHATACGLYMPRVCAPHKTAAGGRKERAWRVESTHVSGRGPARLPRQHAYMWRSCRCRGNARHIIVSRRVIAGTHVSLQSAARWERWVSSCIHGRRALMGEERGTGRAGLAVLADGPPAPRAPCPSLSPSRARRAPRLYVRRAKDRGRGRRTTGCQAGITAGATSTDVDRVVAQRQIHSTLRPLCSWHNYVISIVFWLILNPKHL